MVFRSVKSLEVFDLERSLELSGPYTEALIQINLGEVTNFRLVLKIPGYLMKSFPRGRCLLLTPHDFCS